MTHNMRVTAYINLDNLKDNMRTMYEHIGCQAKLMAIIKANGYGHGSYEVANALENEEYVWGYAAATVEESIELIEQGIRKPIIILGYVFEPDMESLVDYSIRPAVITYEQAKQLSDIAVAKNKLLPIHIKLDTGMHRIGFDLSDESVETITAISKLPGLKMEGMFAHFAKSDERDKTFTRLQYDRFISMKERLKDNGVNFEYYHCGNSAAILDLPEYHLDLMRAGITMYGLMPSDEVDKSLNLKPVMSIVSHVAFVKKLSKGEPIGYGGSYITDRDSIIATIPVGYGDGYPRSLSNKGYVLINGKKAPITGRVCMDQFMVDVTDIGPVKVGDKVTLVGCDGSETITFEQLGDLSGRFNYEFVCDLNLRVHREYVSN